MRFTHAPQSHDLTCPSIYLYISRMHRAVRVSVHACLRASTSRFASHHAHTASEHARARSPALRVCGRSMRASRRTFAPDCRSAKHFITIIAFARARARREWVDNLRRPDTLCAYPSAFSPYIHIHPIRRCVAATAGQCFILHDRHTITQTYAGTGGSNINCR